MRRFVLAAAAIAAIACDQPPAKEIAAAEQQVERARAAQADRYAPERWKQAQTALETAHARLRERDYRAALSAANDAAESARVAVEATGPARATARREADAAVVEAQRMLDRAAAERDAALEAGVPEASLAALDSRRERAAERLAEVTKVVEGGSYDAAARLADLRPEVTALPDLFRDARTQWQAKHPNTRPRPRPRSRRR